jgi:hypothetical protein
MIRRANPSRLQPPPPPTQAESAGRSNSISYGYKVQDAFMVPFGTHQENVKRRCQGTVGLAEATQSKKTPPQSQPPGRGSQSPADQTGCCDFRPASIPSRAGSSQHPSIPSASGQTRRQPRGRAQGPAGGHFASRPPSPASAARTRTVGSASPPDAAAPYLPQHFPAVGAEQVVGRGRRAAATAVHRAGAGLSPRPLAKGCFNVLFSGGRAAATAQRLPARARRGRQPRHSATRCSSRPHRQTPAPPARTSSRGRLSFSVRPRPRGPPPSGQPRWAPPPPANQTAPATPPSAPASNEWLRPIAGGESNTNLRAS